MLRPLLVLVLLAAGWTLTLGGEAQANTCRSLQMQLMQAQAARERNQYRRLQGVMASRGCFGRAERPVARAAPQRKRAAVKRARKPVARARPQQARRPARREQARREPTRRQEGRSRAREPRMSLARSTFRTLCVRSCDGYYFPISFSTTREHFESDQATCNQLCPQAEANIYYHSRTEGPEAMISLDEKPYSDLATAFSYRTSLNPSCSCGPAQPVELTARADAKGSDTYEAQPAQLPRPRSAPGADP
jgi:hypothetical protein